MAVEMKSDGEWPTLDEWPQVQADVTCRTEGCAVNGVAYRVTLYENADGIYRAWCGRCKTPNDDIQVVSGSEAD